MTIRFTFEFLAWKYNPLEGIFEACKTGHSNNLLAFSDRRKALDQIDSFQWACNLMSIIFFVRKKGKVYMHKEIKIFSKV